MNHLIMLNAFTQMAALLIIVVQSLHCNTLSSSVHLLHYMLVLANYSTQHFVLHFQ